jgi:hypothetical protein
MIEAVRELVGAPSVAPEPEPSTAGPRRPRRPAVSGAPAATSPSTEGDVQLPSEAAAEVPGDAAEAPAALVAAPGVAPTPHAEAQAPAGAARAAVGPHVVEESPAVPAGTGIAVVSPSSDAAGDPASAGDPAGAGEPTSAGASAPESDPDLALYRDAHRAHFVQRDARAALAAWDRYLAAHPRGSFALEARYNRALCLVRLGRHEAARQALTPFAAGQVGGGYRRSEASALLEALDGR